MTENADINRIFRTMAGKLTVKLHCPESLEPETAEEKESTFMNDLILAQAGRSRSVDEEHIA